MVPRSLSNLELRSINIKYNDIYRLKSKKLKRGNSIKIEDLPEDETRTVF